MQAAVGAQPRARESCEVVCTRASPQHRPAIAQDDDVADAVGGKLVFGGGLPARDGFIDAGLAGQPRDRAIHVSRRQIDGCIRAQTRVVRYMADR